MVVVCIGMAATSIGTVAIGAARAGDGAAGAGGGDPGSMSVHATAAVGPPVMAGFRAAGGIKLGDVRAGAGSHPSHRHMRILDRLHQLGGGLDYLDEGATAVKARKASRFARTLAISVSEP
jgi:hypothetical protein